MGYTTAMFERLFSAFGGSAIRLQRVVLGDSVIDLPVANLIGQRAGKTLLVTAGVDGDEYAGITAAYQLIERSKNLDFSGRLIIIPIVNIPGFQAECSHNPLDGKFPKYVFPGRVDGSSTDCLMAVIASFAGQADCWFDLHGAALTEGVNPYLWLHKTGNREVDALANDIVHYGLASTILYERAHFGLKSAALAKHGCSYIVAESGSRNTSLAADVARHLAWLTSTMQLLGMIDGLPEKQETQVLTSVSFITASSDGLWQPVLKAPSSLPHSWGKVVNGEILGSCCHLDGTGEKIIRATSSGTSLWWKETSRLKKGDILLATGR
jgi:predicted deacylase